MKPTPRRLSLVLLCALAGAAQATPPDGRWWLLPGQAALELAPCAEQAGHYCGRLLLAERDARDYANPDLFAWGRPLCGQTIVSGLQAQADGRWQGGRLYDPDSGESYALELQEVGDEALRVLVYPDASAEEALDLAVSAARGKLSVLDASYFALRLAIGKSRLGEVQRWARADDSLGDCGARP